MPITRFLNERLARHYGIPGVYGPQFRKVVLTGKERRGLLGKGAVLLRTSYGDRTSPVLRGAWVLDKLMGTPPSPPPPNTATDLSVKAGEKPTTVRARLEQHREQRVCMQCHGVIDPSGLPLESFDAIGRWRTTDRQADNAAIDTRSVLPNGVAINGPGELAAPISQPSGSVRRGPDGKADDIRAQSRPRVFRYASGARGCSCSSEGQLQVFFNRSGYRQYRCVPQAGCGKMIQH